MVDEALNNAADSLSAEELLDMQDITIDRKQREVITLDRIRAGEQPFACWGYSDLKVVKDGVEKILRVPIKSVGIAELMENIARKAPNPPRRVEVTSKDSAAGQALGLKRDRVVEVEDQLDATYLDRVREYELKSTYRLVLHSLAIDLEDARGAVIVKANDEHSRVEVKDEEAAIQVLKESGLTDAHLRQIAGDVRAMSAREVKVTDLE